MTVLDRLIERELRAIDPETGIAVTHQSHA